MKFGNYSNSSMLPYLEYSMVILIGPALAGKHHYLTAFFDRKLNWPAYNGYWFPDQLQYAQFCGYVHASGGRYPLGGKYPKEVPWKYFFLENLV